eukprot:gene9958-7834_t
MALCHRSVGWAIEVQLCTTLSGASPHGLCNGCVIKIEMFDVELFPRSSSSSQALAPPISSRSFSPNPRSGPAPAQATSMTVDNSAAVAGLEPVPLWSFFADISAIPRPSKGEQQLLAWLKSFAEERHLEWKQDDMGNLVVGVATALALLDSGIEVKLPPLECLFTVDEETGLTGAYGISGDLVKGKTMLNLDTEEWTEICIGCAGGGDSMIELDVAKEASPKSTVAFKVSQDTRV